MIIQIDDDPRYVELIREAFHDAGMEFKSFLTVDEGLDWLDLEKNSSLVEFVIFDLAMPTGARFMESPRTEDGLRTGDLVYQAVRLRLPRVPMLLLTNRSAAEPEGFKNDTRSERVLKVELLPSEVVETVRLMCEQLASN